MEIRCKDILFCFTLVTIFAGGIAAPDNLRPWVFLVAYTAASFAIYLPSKWMFEEYLYKEFVALWMRLVALTGLALWAFWFPGPLAEALRVAVAAVIGEVAMAALAKIQDDLPWLVYGAKIIGTALIWWRAVKVIVFMGAPFKTGVAQTRPKIRWDHDLPGKHMSFPLIGNLFLPVESEEDLVEKYERFWFAMISRAHPNSDKLLRHRVILLILTMPFLPSCALLIEESRFGILMGGHAGRRKKYVSRLHSLADKENVKDVHPDFWEVWEHGILMNPDANPYDRIFGDDDDTPPD